jgi:hypothetical protein
MKILSFFIFFGVIFALLDPDPDPAAQINADPCGSGSGSETLPAVFRVRIYKPLRSPGSDSKELILPAYVAF